ncbi:hypothetical protein BGZ65_000475 [Modicella reniformis]|uniref:Uncharacterized protein n=1 Tax=Modicella reniformis TaxID=1440133 RepID=A0A9P6ILY2_9FUNG|nr:hypothetical protein BGZ65_000475 [Modicella reniformis]
MRSSVKSRLLRNWIGQNGHQEYKALERSLARFHQKDRCRMDILKSNLLPWLRKDQPSLDSLSETSLKTGRQLILQWREFEEFDRADDMVSKPTTPSTVRTFIDGSGTGSVTEHTSSTTSVSSSTTLGSGYPFTDSSEFWSSFQQYRKTLTQSLQYAIDRLNQKGAKILAICFFKLPGVAFGLLHALPMSRSYISRMARAMDLIGYEYASTNQAECAIYIQCNGERGYRDTNASFEYRENCGMPQIMTYFPEHLSPICFIGSGSWWREFEKLKRRMNSGDATPPMEMFGNWVRRWQSDDSELFFAFYRHYHHCLSQYLETPLQRIQAGGWASSAITPKVYAGAPGYLYLSAFFLTKIEGLVHREIHPVTTIVQFEPNGNGNGLGAERDRVMASVATGEFPGTAAPVVKLANGGDSGKDSTNSGATTGKPKMLDMASRRFVETIVAIMEDHGSIYGAMLDVWIKVVITKTSVYDVESVFCLLDFLDMLIAELESRDGIRLYDSELSTVPPNTMPGAILIPVHVQFILSTLHLLLTASDHTVTLMRTISFIYQNFSLLTSTVQTLEQLTLGTLLSPYVFEKCFLHWARNVRLYYMRCLVWRVARIGGGVGILPGWKSWAPETLSSQHGQPSSSMGGIALSDVPTSDSFTKRTTYEALEELRGLPIEHSLGLIVRNIFEIMESRIDMVKRQYAGEFTEVMSPTISDKDSEFSPPEPIPSSGLDQTPGVAMAEGPPATHSSHQRPLSDGMIQDEQESFQLQANQIYLSHQTLTQSDDSIKGKGKDRTKDPTAVQVLSEGGLGGSVGRMAATTGQKLRCSSKGNRWTMTPINTLHCTQILDGSGNNNNNKLASGMSSGLSPESYSSQELDKDEDRPGYSNHSLTSFSSTSTSSSLLVNNDQSSDICRHNGASRSYNNPQTASILRYELESRKYPEHLAIYAGRSITEHTAVLNEYVDWLSQCHAYGIKSRMSFTPNGATVGQAQPGGVPGIDLGPTGPSGPDNMFSGFSVFSLSMNGVVEANVVAGHHEEWILPGMA